MSRRRFIYPGNGADPIEVDDDYSPPPREHGRVHGDAHYDGLRAPDGADISTRTKHREYMKARGLTTMDDFSDSFRRAEAQRMEVRRGVDPGRRAQIARAIHQLHTKGK